MYPTTNPEANTTQDQRIMPNTDFSANYGYGWYQNGINGLNSAYSYYPYHNGPFQPFSYPTIQGWPWSGSTHSEYNTVLSQFLTSMRQNVVTHNQNIETQSTVFENEDKFEDNKVGRRILGFIFLFKKQARYVFQSLSASAIGY